MECAHNAFHTLHTSTRIGNSICVGSTEAGRSGVWGRPVSRQAGWHLRLGGDRQDGSGRGRTGDPFRMVRKCGGRGSSREARIGCFRGNTKVPIAWRKAHPRSRTRVASPCVVRARYQSPKERFGWLDRRLFASLRHSAADAVLASRARAKRDGDVDVHDRPAHTPRQWTLRSVAIDALT